MRSGVAMRMIWICSLTDHDLTPLAASTSPQQIHLAREASGVYGGCIFTFVFLFLYLRFHERTKMAGTTNWLAFSFLTCLLVCSTKPIGGVQRVGSGVYFGMKPCILAFIAGCVMRYTTLYIHNSRVFLCIILAFALWRGDFFT